MDHKHVYWYTGRQKSINIAKNLHYNTLIDLNKTCDSTLYQGACNKCKFIRKNAVISPYMMLINIIGVLSVIKW